MPVHSPHLPTSGSTPMHFEWKRFWIRPTALLDLSDAGFLRDPETYPFEEDSLKTFADLDSFPVLALLGEPGTGKSDVLKLEHKRLSALDHESGTLSLHVDLKASSSEDWLCKQIFESPKVKSWKDAASRLYLLLDSLDEAMMRIEPLAHRLIHEFRNLPTDRLSVRIACRTAVWPTKTLGESLKEIWGESNFGIFELAPLRRRDVLTALSANNIDQEEFMQRLFGANAVPFAIKPLTLNMLLRIYKSDGRLPESTSDLYHQGCLALCEEPNPSRRETGNQGNLNGPQRLRLAARIAAATILGNRFAIWTGAEFEASAEDISLSALSGAQEEGNFPTFTATEDNLLEILDTGLFSSRGENRLGWAHQTYGEFLAALYLFDKRVSPNLTLKALTHPNGGLIPQLAHMGAWMASIHPELRTFLIATDPWTLLQGDLSKWSAADKATLVDSMLSHVEEGRSHEIFFGIMEMYEKLNYPNLANQLRMHIINRSFKPTTRKNALAIAKRCELRELQSEILQIALDQTEDPIVRAAAIAALRQCGDASVAPQILALFQGGIGPDPHNEMRGYALDLLWPNFIDTNQLFSLLTTSDEGYLGSYAVFLYRLPEDLKAQDLVSAIAWATAYIIRSNPMGEFYEKTLADAIMFKAWDEFEDPALTSLFMDHVAARLQQFGELFRGSDFKANEAFSERLRSDLARRRQFMLHLFKQLMDRAILFSYLRAGFIQNEDFEWLLEVSPGGLYPISGLNEESLSNIISWLFKYENTSQFETFEAVCRRWPLLRSKFSSLFDGVRLDSLEAEQARECERLNRELQNPAPPSQIQDLSAEISRLLERAEAGEWQVWWRLNHALMITLGNQFIGNELNYFITSMPGWVTSDESVRQRIVSTAERYLTDAETSADIWLGQKTMSLQRNDLAAMRAFILLFQVAPEAYKRIPVMTWEKWMPVIVGLPKIGVTEKSPVIQVLLRNALERSPQSFISTFRKVLHKEKECIRASTEVSVSNASLPFLILSDLEGCWDDEGLKEALFEEMTEPDIKSNEYTAILDALLKANYEPALEHGLRRIDNLGESTSEVVDVLLRRASSRVWPSLWPKLVKDDGLARAILLKAANKSFLDIHFYADFGDKEIADVYLLMERLFPPEDDPKRLSGFVSPLDMIPTLRDDAPRILAARGTENAVRELRRLAAERPNRAILPFELSRGEQNMRQKTWTPLTTREILALTDRQNARLIISTSDLLEILEETLLKYETELHGTQNPVRDLWDRQGSEQIYRPVEEPAVSDVIARYLRRELEGRGIFANREVEVKRRPGAPVGTRTDILINAFRRADDGSSFDSITAVIEVKGCWNSDLFSSLENQLVREYMVQIGASIGIYLVACFDLVQWDSDDYRRKEVPRDTIYNVKERLNQQAAQIPEGFQVKPIVLEIRSPGT